MCIIMHHIPAGTFHQDIHYVLWMHRWGARCTEALHEPQIRHEVHCCAKRCCNALKFKMHRWTAKMHQRELACTAVPRRRVVGCGHNQIGAQCHVDFIALPQCTAMHRCRRMQCSAGHCIKQPCPKGCCYILYYTIFPLVTVHHMSNVGLP